MVSKVSRGILNNMIQKARLMGPFSYIGILWQSVDKHSNTVLDIGCGKGVPIEEIKKSDRGNYLANNFMVGVDMSSIYLEHCKRRGIHNEYVLCDVRLLPFREKSFDIVLCLDLIEHLEKVDGKKLIEALEKIGRRQIIIYTPVDFLPQGEIDGNILQAHRSGWTPRELMSMGYKARGCDGLYFLRGEYGKIRFSGILGTLALILSYLTQPLVYFIPRFAFEMICVKNIGRRQSFRYSDRF